MPERFVPSGFSSPGDSPRAENARSSGPATCRAATGRRARLVLFTLALPLIGCSSSEGDGVGTTLLRGTATPAQPILVPLLQPDVPCPPAQVRYGTEALSIADKAKPGDPAALRFQGRITRVVRECSAGGAGVTIRVGAAGRVLSGPNGSVGGGELPLRVAVVRGDQVLHSQVYRVPFKVDAPDYATQWTVVAENIAIPLEAAADGARIEVGFDEQALTGPRAGKRKPQS